MIYGKIGTLYHQFSGVVGLSGTSARPTGRGRGSAWGSSPHVCRAGGDVEAGKAMAGSLNHFPVTGPCPCCPSHITTCTGNSNPTADVVTHAA